LIVLAMAGLVSLALLLTPASTVTSKNPKR
jgi:hypothetical protein